MACVLFPNQHKRKITISEVISLMESLTLPWDQNSTQKRVPEMQKRQTTYHKIQEMVPLQEKIKRRLKDKDEILYKGDSIDHQSTSTSIKDQSRPSSIGVNWHPLKPTCQFSMQQPPQGIDSTSIHMDAFIFSYISCNDQMASLSVNYVRWFPSEL